MFERSAGAAAAALPRGYRPRRPEQTVLYELVSAYREPMLRHLREVDPKGYGLPRHVDRELEAYLRCGVMAHGFTRVRCGACGDEMLVAFSCKCRGLCPSCTARRMADTAAHLVDRVLPAARYRPWVFTVPRSLRLRLAREPAWASWVNQLIVRAIAVWQRRAVFVDTGAWIAMAQVRDPLHVRARETWEQMDALGARTRTSVPVVLETFTFLERNTTRDVALAWKDSLNGLVRFAVLECTTADVSKAWTYFRRKDLHKLSAVDATSFVVMARAKIRTAFAFDHHFATAGFRIVG